MIGCQIVLSTICWVPTMCRRGAVRPRSCYPPIRHRPSRTAELQPRIGGAQEVISCRPDQRRSANERTQFQAVPAAGDPTALNTGHGLVKALSRRIAGVEACRRRGAARNAVRGAGEILNVPGSLAKAGLATPPMASAARPPSARFLSRVICPSTCLFPKTTCVINSRTVLNSLARTANWTLTSRNRALKAMVRRLLGGGECHLCGNSCINITHFTVSGKVFAKV